MKHTNTPTCDKCEEVLNRYPGFHPGLRTWFYTVRSSNPDAHISAAGRGKADQEAFFKAGTSKAHYGQSAHNYNAAVDFFRLTLAGGAAFDAPWYKSTIGPAALSNPNLRWYGQPPISFLEYPHVEVAAWRQMVREGQLLLVDGPAAYPISES